MTNKLYIIGNGFDLHHGLNTSYANFREHIKKYHPGIWKLLCEIYGKRLLNDMWWNNFEEELGKVDYNSIANSPNGKAIGFAMVRNLLVYQLPLIFGNWINDMPMSVRKDPQLDIDVSASFFTFNYTMTLETSYNVPSENIWHIHNSIKDFNEGRNPIVGHDSDVNNLLTFYLKHRDELTNVDSVFVDNINKELASGAKHVIRRINDEKSRFYQYTDLNNFIIMGFSLNGIDNPYIQEFIKINNNIDSTHWTIYWHTDKDYEILKNKLILLGIKEEHISLVNW